jgi:hypothetical protein
MTTNPEKLYPLYRYVLLTVSIVQSVSVSYVWYFFYPLVKNLECTLHGWLHSK